MYSVLTPIVYQIFIIHINSVFIMHINSMKTMVKKSDEVTITASPTLGRPLYSNRVCGRTAACGATRYTARAQHAGTHSVAWYSA